MTTTTTEKTKTRATIDYLKKCQEARAAGYPVRFVTDPAWLVEQAINRRAGWVEDPHYRGTSQPISGCFSNGVPRLPRKCCGMWQRHLWRIARDVNRPRLIIRPASLGEHRWLVDRLPERFCVDDD